jgi:TonB-linked SusC/RagA family outer membrane protein
MKMKYNKIVILFCVMLTFFYSKLYGQDTNNLYSLLFDKESNQHIGTSFLAYNNIDDLKLKGDSSALESDAGINTESEDLLPEEEAEEEMVNVPFRQVDRRNLVGGVTILNPADVINKDFNISVTDGISGRIAGLLWANNIWGFDNALVMIDGAPRNYSDIKFDEIEQISVLKGVNAVALYGSHAANGVILITTKRGQVIDGHQINVRVNSGIQTARALPEFLNSADYMVLFNEARENDGLDRRFDDGTINNFRTGNPYRFPSVDYYSSDYLADFATNNDVHTEFIGGTEDARFYANVGWRNNSTLLNFGEGANEGDNRFNVRGNIDLVLNEYISSSIDVSAIFQNSRRGHGNYWGNAATIRPNEFAPIVPIGSISGDSLSVIDLAEGSRNIIDGRYILSGSHTFLEHPIADMYVAGYNNNMNRIMQINNTIDFDLKNLLSGLKFHTKFNADFYNSYNQSINNTYSIYLPTWLNGDDVIVGLERLGRDERPGVQNIGGTAQSRSLGYSMMFSFLRNVNNDHNISALLLGSANMITVNNVIQPIRNTNAGLHLGYDFKHKYIIDFSGAIVHSTKLAQGNRIGFSPTIGLGWLLSSEDFLAGSDVIDHLKLTAQAGILNTDVLIDGHNLYANIHNYHGWYAWNDGANNNLLLTSQQGANPGLYFAQRKEVNLGIEGAFFNRLLWLESSFFITQMDGLPTRRLNYYPSYMSDVVPWENYNRNKYSGVDFLMNIRQNFGELNMNIGLNMTYAVSEVIKRDELFAFDYLERVGRPVDAIFGLENAGFFMNEQEILDHSLQVFSMVVPGDIKYVDQNGDGIIDENDVVMIGRWIAPFNFGLNLSFSYRKFSLFVQGTGHLGGNGIKSGNYYWAQGNDKYSIVTMDRWTEATKENATYPRLSSIQNPNNFRQSDFWIYSTDRFDIRKVQISYDIIDNNSNNSIIKNLGVYVYGANLLTIAENKDIMLLNVGFAPQYRYFNIGLRANF